MMYALEHPMCTKQSASQPWPVLQSFHTASVPSRAFGTMDILREFLESSTIHGLNYISTAKVGEICDQRQTTSFGELKLV